MLVLCTGNSCKSQIAEVCSPDFAKEIVKTFQTLRPLRQQSRGNSIR